MKKFNDHYSFEIYKSNISLTFIFFFFKSIISQSSSLIFRDHLNSQFFFFSTFLILQSTFSEIFEIFKLGKQVSLLKFFDTKKALFLLNLTLENKNF